MKIRRLSASSINKFFSCPRRWYYEETGKEGIVVDETPLLVGKFVHKVIDEYFSILKDKPAIFEIEEKVKTAFENCFDPALKSEIIEEAKKNLDGFIEFEKFRMKNWVSYLPTFTEKKLFANLFGVEFVGVIDFYSLDDKIAIDWKTSINPYDVEERARQGKIYSLLLTNNNYPVNKIYFYSLKAQRALETPKVDDSWIEREINLMIKKIEQDDFEKNEGALCKYCPYVLRCEYEKNRLWLNDD